MPIQAIADEYVTTSQAARRLGISAERIRQLMRAGTLPVTPTPLGRLLHIRDLEQLEQQREHRLAERRPR